jgi:hypothetical protein
MAVSRRVFNPTEAKDVVGITNYIDIGGSLVSPRKWAQAGKSSDFDMN